MEQFHQFRLISWIKLNEEENDIEIQVGSTRHQFWILQHFGYLELSSYDLLYKIDNGPWQRKKSKPPIQRMRKKFQNLFELLAYLDIKQCYDICHFQCQFTNGWKVKLIPFIDFKFITNKKSERNQLLRTLLHISAISSQKIRHLKSGYYEVKTDKDGQYLSEHSFDE